MSQQVRSHEFLAEPCLIFFSLFYCRFILPYYASLRFSLWRDGSLIRGSLCWRLWTQMQLVVLLGMMWYIHSSLYFLYYTNVIYTTEFFCLFFCYFAKHLIQYIYMYMTVKCFKIGHYVTLRMFIDWKVFGNWSQCGIAYFFIL